MMPVARQATGGTMSDDEDFGDALSSPIPETVKEETDMTGDADGGDDAVSTADAIDENARPKKFTLSVLEFLNGLQAQHGLRHDDFERYRRYCTRRLARIRVVIKFKHGTRRAYAQRTITREVMTDVKFLHVMLLMADRAWAYYMQLKAESNGDDRKRHHMLARVVKAAKHAAALQDLVGTDGEVCDERSELEVAAYAHWLHALKDRESKRHPEAIKLFSSAKAIYERLGSVCSEHARSLYTKRVEEIDSQIRYCTFMTGGSVADIDEFLASSTSDEFDLLKEKISRVVEAQKKAKSNDLSSVEWLGRTEGVQSQSLAMSLLKIKKKKTAIEDANDSEKWIEAYDDLLGTYGEAMTTVSEEIVAEKKVAEPSQEKILSCGFLLDYLTFCRLEHSVARTLKMAADSEGRGDAVTSVARLYDMAGQTLDEMSDIQSGQEDSGFTKRIAARKCTFRGYRCSLLAAGHLSEGRVREASALIDRAVEMASLAKADFSECAGEQTPEDLTFLKLLEKRLRRDSCHLRAKAFEETHTEPTSDATLAAAVPGKPLKFQLDSFEAGTLAAEGTVPLTHFPPDFEAVPPKPLFFDLASSRIDFDESAIAARAQKPEVASTLGAVTGAATGALKSLFGGWG